MHRLMRMVTLIVVVALAGGAGFGREGLQAQAGKSKPLDIYFIDVEGGQATLIVSPSGQSLLVDAGWPGLQGRDADRIAAAAKKAGVTQIDYFVASHYHTDHIGGVPQLAEKLPIRNFVDHGPSVESGERPDALFKAYADARAKGKHLQVKPGDKIPISGLDVQVVAAGGEHLTKAINGGGQPNGLCADFKPKDADPSENARSVGILVTSGKFRFLDLGDLTWNKEQELVCPNNLLGTIDVYLTTHHGSAPSGPPAIVHALKPRVAIMNNGAKKGGNPEAWRTVRQSPGLEDLWQVHYSVEGATEHNVAEPLIANMDESTAHGIRVSANPNGSFTVFNDRNGNSKRYEAK
jgi:beta-lactamase superfamily II metal-dependent hydrolase